MSLRSRPAHKRRGGLGLRVAASMAAAVGAVVAAAAFWVWRSFVGAMTDAGDDAPVRKGQGRGENTALGLAIGFVLCAGSGIYSRSTPTPRRTGSRARPPRRSRITDQPRLGRRVRRSSPTTPSCHRIQAGRRRFRRRAKARTHLAIGIGPTTPHTRSTTTANCSGQLQGRALRD